MSISTSVPFQYTTTASTNLTTVRGGGSLAAKLKGYALYNNTGTTYYVKLWWGANGATPTVGTTVPHLTIASTTATGAVQSFPDGITNNGQLYMWVTASAAATDTTATSAGGLITLLVE